MDKEETLEKIFRHELFGKLIIVGGCFEYIDVAKSHGKEIDTEEVFERINTSKNVFSGWIGVLKGADKDNLPKWFTPKNACYVENMAKFDWKEEDRFNEFYGWIKNYYDYLHNL